MKLDLLPARIEQLNQNGVFVVTKVDDGTIELLQNWILSYCDGRKKQHKLTIAINSSGGSPVLVLCFSSFLKTLKNIHLTGVAFGECGSAAFTLLQCCDTRIAVADCGFFIHHVETTTTYCAHFGIKHDDIDERINYDRFLENELIDLHTKRSGMKRSEWIKLADFGQHNPGTPMFCKQIKQLGLVDKVVKTYSLF